MIASSSDDIPALRDGPSGPSSGQLVTKTIVLLTGSNLSGPWGDPARALDRVARSLPNLGVHITAASPLYRTRAIGPHQPDYLNQALLIETSLAPATLLRDMKRLEVVAGRRARSRWTARPLDIDIVAFRGQRNLWPARRGGSVTLPHPEAHRRAFVLVALLTLAPKWYHSALRVPGGQLYRRLPARDRSGVRVARGGGHRDVIQFRLTAH